MKFLRRINSIQFCRYSNITNLNDNKKSKIWNWRSDWSTVRASEIDPRFRNWKSKRNWANSLSSLFQYLDINKLNIICQSRRYNKTVATYSHWSFSKKTWTDVKLNPQYSWKIWRWSCNSHSEWPILYDIFYQLIIVT